MHLFQTNIVKLNFIIIRENIQNPTYYFLQFHLKETSGIWKAEALIKSVMVVEFSFS